MMDKHVDFPHTRQALLEHAETQEIRDRWIHEAETEADVLAWKALEAEAVNVVRRAFYEDTKDRNSLSHCMAVDLHTLRHWCQLPCGTVFCNSSY